MVKDRLQVFMNDTIKEFGQVLSNEAAIRVGHGVPELHVSVMYGSFRHAAKNTMVQPSSGPPTHASVHMFGADAPNHRKDRQRSEIAGGLRDHAHPCIFPLVRHYTMLVNNLPQLSQALPPCVGQQQQLRGRPMVRDSRLGGCAEGMLSSK